MILYDNGHGGVDRCMSLRGMMENIMYEALEIGKTDYWNIKKVESKSTKTKLPVKLLYYREYATINEAMQMETKLKKWKSKFMIERFMQDR